MEKEIKVKGGRGLALIFLVLGVISILCGFGTFEYGGIVLIPTGFFLLACHWIIHAISDIRYYLIKLSASPDDITENLNELFKQSKKDALMLNKTLTKLAEKTDKTNAYLHHIYQNSTKAPPPPPPPPSS